MSTEDYILTLQQNEQFIKTVRQFPLVHAKEFLLWLVLFLAPFFFLLPLSHLWPPKGMVGGGVVVLIAALLILRVLIKWYYTKLLITSRRIIGVYQKGLFDRTVSDADYGRIIKLSFSVEGMTQTLFNFGTLEIETFSQKQFPAMKVGKPEHIYTFISKLQHESETNDEKPIMRKGATQL